MQLERRKNRMKEKPSGAELVAAWRNGGAQDNPAGPLFAAGQFAEADITNDCSPGMTHCGTQCTGSITAYCC
jgi:hypothetical protein